MLPLASTVPELALGKYVRGLFAQGEQGVWYDPSDMSTLFQDAAGTTPVTAVGQPVGLMLDKSGRGNHASQPTATSRPVLSARYNLLTKTEQFDDAVWVKGGVTAEPSSVTPPYGAGFAHKLIESSNTEPHHVYQFCNTPGGSPNTQTIFLRAGERFRGRLRFGTNVGFIGHAFFDLAAGQITGQGGLSAATMTAGNDGWWKLAITATTQAGSVNTSLDVFLHDSAGVDSYAGDGTSGIYIWGADLRVANDGINLPPYQRVNTATDYDTQGFPHYLRFDGVDDWLVTPSIDFTATDKMTVFAGVRKLSDAATGALLELSPVADTNAGTFYVLAPGGAGENKFVFLTRGSVGLPYAVTTDAAYSAPYSAVVTGRGSISEDVSLLRVNGAQVGTASADQGTGNYGNYPLYIGRRGGTTLPFNGHLYSLLIAGRLLSDRELTSAEKYANDKTRAFA